ncbi:unnamed protein product [Lasius platythorax]|uniref:Uncharacterized protein n=1 Tax=Lasius platythorax TaxID=488582 RepID=A0AAV2NAB9_9HYME
MILSPRSIILKLLRRGKCAVYPGAAKRESAISDASLLLPHPHLVEVLTQVRRSYHDGTGICRISRDKGMWHVSLLTWLRWISKDLRWSNERSRICRSRSPQGARNIDNLFLIGLRSILCSDDGPSASIERPLRR